MNWPQIRKLKTAVTENAIHRIESAHVKQRRVHCNASVRLESTTRSRTWRTYHLPHWAFCLPRVQPFSCFCVSGLENGGRRRAMKNFQTRAWNAAWNLQDEAFFQAVAVPCCDRSSLQLSCVLLAHRPKPLRERRRTESYWCVDLVYTYTFSCVHSFCFTSSLSTVMREIASCTCMCT